MTNSSLKKVLLLPLFNFFILQGSEKLRNPLIATHGGRPELGYLWGALMIFPPSEKGPQYPGVGVGTWPSSDQVIPWGFYNWN